MRVCIIGTGDGGATAANQVRRLDSEAQIDVFTNRAELGCPPCEMPLVIGGSVATWDELIRGFRQPLFWEKRRLKLHLKTEVTDIIRHGKCIIAGGEKYDYDKLILALGATPTIPPFPGLDGKNEFALSTDMADGIALESAISRYAEAAIVGGGFIGLEIADALKARNYSKVYLVVRRQVLRAYLDEDIAEKLEDVMKQHGVELILPARVESIIGKNGRKRVILSDRELDVDFVFFATGVEPNVGLARKAGLQIGETGAIAVNQYHISSIFMQ